MTDPVQPGYAPMMSEADRRAFVLSVYTKEQLCDQLAAVRGELAALRRQQEQRAEFAEGPLSRSHGDAVMLFNTEGRLAWHRIVPTGEGLGEDIDLVFEGRPPPARIEVIREAPPPPQELMAAQLAALRRLAGAVRQDDLREEMQAVLNWQEPLVQNQEQR